MRKNFERMRVSNSQELLPILEKFKAKGNIIFRGQSNSGWRLYPAIFRDENKEKLAQQYPVLKSEILQWFKNKEMISNIEIYGIKFKNINPIIIKNLFELYIYIMQYNYHLFEFVESNQERICVEDLALLGKFESKKHWVMEETFVAAISHAYSRLLQYWDLDNKLIFESKPFEFLTGVDEALPQHYGFPTAALDWTYDPLVAIYFAIRKFVEKRNVDDDIDKTLSSSKNSKFFSIYVYEQVQSEEVEISIKPIKNPNNIRALKQKGILTCFEKPCSFYVTKGRFPSIDDYINHYYSKSLSIYPFYITQINIDLTKKNLCFLDKILKDGNYIEEFLLPGGNLVNF